MSDLWTAASIDAEQELRLRLVTSARVGVQSVWAFLASADDEADYANRLAMCAERIEAAVADATATDPEQFVSVRDQVIADLRDEYKVIAAQRERERIAAAEPDVRARITSELARREANTMDEGGEYVSNCPACGNPIDYCQGHGPSGDPNGYRILEQHDNGDHTDCHPDGCDDAGRKLSSFRDAALQVEAVAWARRHYEDMAETIAKHPERQQLADHFANHLAGTNPHYRQEQFRSAASTEGYTVRGGTGTANYSKGHFQHIADAIKSYPGDKHSVAQHFAQHLAGTNPRFDQAKFLKAATGSLQREAAEGDERAAKVTSGARDLAQVQQYMPSNYTASEHGGTIWISGRDRAGWTLDGYVIPRLASGLIFAEEVSSEGQGETWASLHTAANEPDTYIHAFHTFMGLPPDKSDKPVCNAELSDAYDFAPGHRPVCPNCDAIMKAHKVSSLQVVGMRRDDFKKGIRVTSPYADLPHYFLPGQGKDPEPHQIGTVADEPDEEGWAHVEFPDPPEGADHGQSGMRGRRNLLLNHERVNLHDNTTTGSLTGRADPFASEADRRTEATIHEAAKMSPEHQEALRSAITPLDTSERREKYKGGNFPRADRVKDLDKRYRWDLLWESGAHKHIQDADYKDSHIDTALRSIVKPLHHTGSMQHVAYDWPSAPSKNFPGEMTIACPKCGSTDVVARGANLTGDPARGGGVWTTLTCNDCGHHKFFEHHRSSVTAEGAGEFDQLGRMYENQIKNFRDSGTTNKGQPETRECRHCGSEAKFDKLYASFPTSYANYICTNCNKETHYKPEPGKEALLNTAAKDDDPYHNPDVRVRPAHPHQFGNSVHAGGANRYKANKAWAIYHHGQHTDHYVVSTDVGKTIVDSTGRMKTSWHAGVGPGDLARMHINLRGPLNKQSLLDGRRVTIGVVAHEDNKPHGAHDDSGNHADGSSGGGGGGDGKPPFPPADDAAQQAPGEEGGDPAADPAAALTPGQEVTVNYTMPDGTSGSCPATVQTSDGQTATFTYENGTFTVTQNNGAWTDSGGATFTFGGGDGGGDEEEPEEDPSEDAPPKDSGDDDPKKKKDAKESALRVTALKYKDLPEGGNPSMACPNESCEEHGNLYSATKGDYFMAHPEHEVRCGSCGGPMKLARERRHIEFEGSVSEAAKGRYVLRHDRYGDSYHHKTIELARRERDHPATTPAGEWYIWDRHEKRRVGDDETDQPHNASLQTEAAERVTWSEVQHGDEVRFDHPGATWFKVHNPERNGRYVDFKWGEDHEHGSRPWGEVVHRRTHKQATGNPYMPGQNPYSVGTPTPGPSSAGQPMPGQQTQQAPAPDAVEPKTTHPRAVPSGGAQPMGSPDLSGAAPGAGSMGG